MTVYCTVLLARPMALAGRIPWNRFCLSLPPDICMGVFFELDHYISLGFCQGARNHYEVVHDNLIFLKNFSHQNWGNGPKIGFLNLKKNLVINFHWICSIMNMFIISCVSTQNLCLGKILFLRCRPKYSQLIKLHNF